MKSDQAKTSFDKLPRHVAIIMDGNGRWAKKRHLNRLSGHRRGATTVRNVVTELRRLGVDYLTLYAFSEENWKRPQTEINMLMRILKKFLLKERKLLKEKDVRLTTIGDISKLPKDVQKILSDTILLTQDHRSMTLVLALSYGGRDEITRAIRTIGQKIAQNKILPTSITAEMISEHLDTAGMPDPDFLIRTSGEFRTSNFLPWQAVYAELYVTPTPWPEFSNEELHKALHEYEKRERRFGLISEQLPQKSRLRWLSAR